MTDPTQAADGLAMMSYRTLRQVVRDLEKNGHLIRCPECVDPLLEVAEIQRRLYRSNGPAVLMENVRGCRFPLLANLFGTLDRAHFLFRHTFDRVRRLIELKQNVEQLMQHPLRYLAASPAALHMRPRRRSRGSVFSHRLTIEELPQIQSWPDDGGAFITLPQVYSEHVETPGLANSNLGMYRVQLSGGQYQPGREVGLHYQLHRGIGVHHAAARERGCALPVNIFVGGTPAMTLAAVMPLPEGMSELGFAGALAGHRIPMVTRAGELPVYAEADFCIRGTIDPNQLRPEGPFGDHLGYYSLAHDFPVLQVQEVYCRSGAIWPFTVVGRPPQEDTVFGQLIHDLTAPVIPALIPGIHGVHAVDAAGVHPLLLAIGSERYLPYESTRKPRELLTQASAVLGQGQMSLAKYLWIIDHYSAPDLPIQDVDQFFQQILRRVDWQRDLHFHTRTTIDTLDYSGPAMHEGSKVVIAAAGPAIRSLPQECSADLQLADGFSDARVCLPGILAIQGPQYSQEGRAAIQRLCQSQPANARLSQFPLVVVVDDSEFVARRLDNFLWVVFTRSDPAMDIDGIESFIEDKHWGCRGALVIDARIKPRHAPPLVEDPEVCRKIDAMAARGGPLAPYL
jgi:4-hydroxy-3-polyprenylbenzoate decarboxylase